MHVFLAILQKQRQLWEVRLFTKTVKTPPDYLATAVYRYTGELIAILKALEMAYGLPEAHIVIVTDSMSSTLGIKQIYPTNKVLIQIKEQLYRLQNNQKTIKLIWVPSHIGIQGNEEADKTAVAATADRNTPIIEKIPHSDFKQTIQEFILSHWQSTWEQVNNSKAKEIIPYVKHNLLLPKSRKNQVILTRLIIGHTQLTHRHIFEKSAAPECPVCATPMTVKHVLIECPKYENERANNNIANNIKSTLTRNSDNIFKFLKDTHLYNLI